MPDLLAITDATSVLIAHECNSSAAEYTLGVVKSKVVDAWKYFEVLISKHHGYATSISHAFIFMHAHLQGYQHVTINLLMRR